LEIKWVTVDDKSDSNDTRLPDLNEAKPTNLIRSPNRRINIQDLKIEWVLVDNKFNMNDVVVDEINRDAIATKLVEHDEIKELASTPFYMNKLVFFNLVIIAATRTYNGFAKDSYQKGWANPISVAVLITLSILILGKFDRVSTNQVTQEIVAILMMCYGTQLAQLYLNTGFCYLGPLDLLPSTSRSYPLIAFPLIYLFLANLTVCLLTVHLTGMFQFNWARLLGKRKEQIANGNGNKQDLEGRNIESRKMAMQNPGLKVPLWSENRPCKLLCTDVNCSLVHYVGDTENMPRCSKAVERHTISMDTNEIL
jgi:hypothetical protein